MKFRIAAILLVLAATAPTFAANCDCGGPRGADAVARSEMAREVAALAWPNGTYARILKDRREEVSQSIFLQLLIQSKAAIEASEDKSLDQALARVDPQFNERKRIALKIIDRELEQVYQSADDRARSAMAEVYAFDFSQSELAEIRSFLSTPAGAAFAGRSTELLFRQDFQGMMEAMFDADIEEKLPVLGAMIAKATAHLSPLPATSGTGLNDGTLNRARR